jgi:uncharacterized protein (TIGR02246 family)
MAPANGTSALRLTREEPDMDRSTRVATALLLAMACAPAGAEDVSAADCFIKGFEAGDAEAVTACYAPDAVLWIPGAPMAKGKQAIRAGFAGYFAAYKVKDMSIVPLGSKALGDEVVTWGTYTIVASAKATGVESTVTGRFTDVSRKIDGRWVYLVDHASDDPAPAPAK